jgi:hypothetical protein
VIQRSFPAEIYDGVITHYDDKLDDPEFDEEKELYEGHRLQLNELTLMKRDTIV